MKKYMCSIKDNVAGSFGSVVLYNNIELAKRDFVELKKKTPFYSDLSLYQVGVFEDDTGEILLNSDEDKCPVFIMNGEKEITNE